MDDHPFSEYLRILGKGPKSRRALTEAEACTAIANILDGKVTEKQLGAFLLLMRANGETPAELIGFVKGIRQFFGLDQLQADIDLDWSAYAGKWRYPPYFLLAIKLLDQNGYRILMHGNSGQFNNRRYVAEFLDPLNLPVADSIEQAQSYLNAGQSVYLPLEQFALPLKNILHLKQELGVRTVFNTAVKCLNPLNAPAAIQGIYHKGVENLHHAVANALQTPNNLVFKGEGGEPEMRADALTHLYFSSANQKGIEDVVFKGLVERQKRPENWSMDHLLTLWQGEVEDIYGEAAVIATAACALMLSQTEPGQQVRLQKAIEQARGFWHSRLR